MEKAKLIKRVKDVTYAFKERDDRFTFYNLNPMDWFGDELGEELNIRDFYYNVDYEGLLKYYNENIK